MSQFKLCFSFSTNGRSSSSYSRTCRWFKAGKKEQVLLGELEQEKHLLLLMLSKNIINQRWF